MRHAHVFLLLTLAAALAAIHIVAGARTADSKERSTTMLRPDYATLELNGNGHRQDSFSLVICEAARLLGREADYETVYCLSSNAFAPAIDLGENCTAWWHVQGRQADKAMNTVADARGLRPERLEMPSHGLNPDDSKEELERKALIARKKCAAIVQRKMEVGAVVITDGGWRIRAEEGFTPWCWWGIITGSSEDGTICGACLGANPRKAQGFRDRPLDYVGGSWAITRGESSPDPERLYPIMLRQAIERIRGSGPYTAAERPVYGLDAMDAWLSQMVKVPFCTACAHAGPKGMAGCAVNNVETTRAGAQAAASYLRRIAPDQTEGARSHLDQAAVHYERIVELLTPATWAFYREMLNDAQKQKAHAESTLEPVRAELVAAADAVEQALMSMSQ